MQSDFALVIEKRPVKNFWKGRGGFLPIAIVERMMQGSIEDAEQYFNGRSPEGVFAVSAHYGIARDGRVWQFVEDDNTAWSNGVLQNPDLSIGWLKEVYQEKVNCNLVTLSVDYEGYSGEALTHSQYEAALALHRQLIQRWEIEADNQHIIGHNWIDSLERSHNPGPLFPFSQLIKDLNTNPSEMAQPSAPAQPDLLAFLESPMPGAEMEVTPPAVVETEPVAAYQPETVEEPLYSPQLEAFTITPELNEEIDRDTAEPVEVEPASAEPETETAPAEMSQDQPEEASAFETAAPSPVDQPEEASSFEQFLSPLPEQPEESQQAESYTPEMTEAALPVEEVESEVAGVPEEQPAQTQAEEAVSEPAPVEEAAEAASQPALAEEEAAEGEPETGAVEAEPSASETFEAQGQPEETLSGAPPAEELPEAATQAENATPAEPAYQFENFDLDDIEAALAYQPKTTRPGPAQRATAPEPAAQSAPVEETAETGSPVEETAAQAESAPVEEISEPATQVEPAPVEDISEPAPQAEVSPTEEVAEAASQPEEAAQVETESVAYPGETAQVEPEEAALEAVGPEAEETTLEAVEPEAAAAEPANEPENLPGVFDAPGQPESLAQLEAATFEGVEENAPGAAEPQVAAEPTESGEEVAAGQNEPGEEVVEPIESGELASEPTGAEPVAGQSEAAEPIFEEAQPEEATQSAEDSTAFETFPVENAEPAMSTGEQPGQEQDDWAADLFAGEAVPGFEEAATLAPEPSTELESSQRPGAPTTAELEVSPAIGDDITPKYSRPPFFDTSYTYEPTPLEITGLDEEATEPVSDDAGAAPLEAQAVTQVEETENAVGEAATPAEEAAAEPESFSEQTGTLAVEPPAEEISEPSETNADEPAEEVSEPLGQEASAVGVEEAAPAAEEAAEEVTALPAVEETATPVPPEEAVAVEAPVEEAAAPVETELPAGEVGPGPAAPEAQLEEPAAPMVETEKPSGKRHWYDRIFNLFGGQDNKSAQPEQPGAVQEQPPAQEQPVTKEARFESPAPANFVEPGPGQAVEAPRVSTNEPETYQHGYATEQALFPSEDSPATGTIEAATEPARFEAVTIPQPAILPVEPAPTEAETTSEATAPATQPENQTETPVEAKAAPEESFIANQPEMAQQPSTEPAPAEESFYPFELENTDSSNYAAYYQAGAVEEQPAGSNAFNFDLPAFEEGTPATSYSQDYSTSGPSDYPFDLPTPEPSESYFQSFAPATQPAAEPHPEAEAVIPPFSLEPEKAAEEPHNLFDTAPSSAGRPQFDADALELPSWLDEPDNSISGTAGEALDSNLSTEPATPPFEPTEQATPASVETETEPSAGAFAWAGNSDQESALPGWLQNEKEDGDLPDWLKDATGQTGVGSAQTAAPENNLSSQPVQAPAFKDAPAVEIPNKDWLENENLFEDEDFFSLLNQSGLDLSLERGGTGALPSLESTSSSVSPTSSAPGAGPAPVQPEPATPASPAPSQGASSSEADFDNIFDEVPQAPAPNKVTVHQLIDRNDGYTAPLSYEDLDMSVPLGLDEDITMPGTFRPIPSEPEPAAPVAPPPPPTRADPPGFHRIPLGKGHTSVELANIRTVPSYDKSTVLRVSEQGERFEFDGWIEGPELRGSNRWYRILTPSGDEWIHSTLVQLDRPFRG